MLFQLPFCLVGEVGFIFNGTGRDTQFSLGNVYLKTNCFERIVSHSHSMLFLMSHNISGLRCCKPLDSPNLRWNSLLLLLVLFMGSNLKRDINLGVGVTMVPDPQDT